MCSGMLLITFCFIFGVSLSRTLAECPPEFDKLCSCGYVQYGADERFTYVTNCTNAGFDNVLMLRKMPMETEVLIFVGNEVKDLPLNIFDQDKNYEKLHTIDFSDNHIQTIKGRTFHNVANVTKLILNDNDLYIVYKDHHPRMFSNFVNLKELHLRNAFTEKVRSDKYLKNLIEVFGNSSLKNLRVLHLDKNEIFQIEPTEFCFLPSLEELYLSDNHIRDLTLNFSCLLNLQVLDVGHNLIPRLDDNTILELDMRRNLRLNMTGNPFRCDCNLVSTYEWMKTTSVQLINREYLFCYDGYPPNIGQSVMALAVEDLECQPVIVPYDARHSITFIVLIISLAIFGIFLLVVIVKNWKGISNSVRNIFRPLRSKFRYVSLEIGESSFMT